MRHGRGAPQLPPDLRVFVEEPATPGEWDPECRVVVPAPADVGQHDQPTPGEKVEDAELAGQEQGMPQGSDDRRRGETRAIGDSGDRAEHCTPSLRTAAPPTAGSPTSQAGQTLVSPADPTRWRPRARSSTTRICSPNASATASTQPSGCASPPPTWNAPARNSSASPRSPWPVRSADTPPTVICRARAPRAIGVHVAGQGPSVRATCADWRMPPSELDRKTLKPQVADLGLQHGSGDVNRTRAVSLGSNGA